jgi:predicted small lipoprotein YifL
MRPAAILLALAAAVPLSGCGQKGPLYLPDHKPQAVTPPAAAPAPAPVASPAPAPDSPQAAPAPDTQAPGAPGTPPKKNQDDGTPPQ